MPSQHLESRRHPTSRKQKSTPPNTNLGPKSFRPQPPIQGLIYNYKKGDYTGFNDYILKFNWEKKLAFLDIAFSYQQLLNTYNEASELFIPKIKIRAIPKYKAPWMTNDLLLQIKAKKHLFFKNVSSKWKVHELVSEFKDCRMLIKAAIKKRVTNFEMEIQI